MGTDNLLKRRQEQRNKRYSKLKQLRAASWLIVTEGEKTEPNYFKSLLNYVNEHSNGKIKYDIYGKGKNTTSLVSSVDDLLFYSDKLIRNKDIPYGKVFVVFDKDSFPSDQFNKAIQMCEQREWISLWSNECIELWFLLHFNFLDAKIDRKEYIKKLNKLLGNKYLKNGNNFELLGGVDKIAFAYKNSKLLYKKHLSEPSYSKKCPCTTVFRFIDEIEKETNYKLK